MTLKKVTHVVKICEDQKEQQMTPMTVMLNCVQIMTPRCKTSMRAHAAEVYIDNRQDITVLMLPLNLMISYNLLSLSGRQLLRGQLKSSYTLLLSLSQPAQLRDKRICDYVLV